MNHEFHDLLGPMRELPPELIERLQDLTDATHRIHELSEGFRDTAELLHAEKGHAGDWEGCPADACLERSELWQDANYWLAGHRALLELDPSKNLWGARS